MTTESKMQELKTRLREIFDLEAANALLSWDQSTYMPPGGTAARARQSALLGRLAHERQTDPALGRLLDDLQNYGESLPYESDDAALLRIARRNFERMNRVPSEFIEKFYSHSANAYQAWTAARPANDFKGIATMLEKTLDYSRQMAGFFPGYEHMADPLIDFSDFGMKASTIRSLFAELRQQLRPLVEAIASQPPADDSVLHRFYPEAEQLAFGRKVSERLGYDFQRGRLDKTHHPFETRFSIGDVRITTRVKERDLGDCLFSIIHESGHAMYEQGIDTALEGTPLAEGTSSGVHESQSRLWENVVGRSRGFWEHFYPCLLYTSPSPRD